MCIVKVINNSYNHERDIKNLINYIVQPSHCQCGLYGATAMNIGNVDEMSNAMKNVKKEFKKIGGRQLLHIVISFDNEREAGITPNMAYMLGYRFVAEFFDGQQVVFAVHDNEDNLHIHIVVNSVSYDTGLKYGISLNGVETMKRIMNGLIERYCLKVGIESLE